MNIHCDKQTTMAVMENIRDFKPDTVITNSPDDIHNDHRETAKIVQQAVFHLRTWGNYNRPIQLYCGEIFQPLAAPHMVLPADINLKRQVMNRFSSQNDQYKWLELVETLNRFRALQFNSDCAYAEAFSVICKW
jgi:LmbE family N-acetylglucosaminyl deacetylase